jgi:hypothetical protein
VVAQAIALLRHRGRLTYRTLQLQFQLDDAHLEALKDELIEGQCLAGDEAGRVLVWIGASGATASLAAASSSMEPPPQAPFAYTPTYLAEKILTSRSALEGERKQVTVLFADILAQASSESSDFLMCAPCTSEGLGSLEISWAMLVHQRKHQSRGGA